MPETDWWVPVDALRSICPRCGEMALVVAADVKVRVWFHAARSEGEDGEPDYIVASSMSELTEEILGSRMSDISVFCRCCGMSWEAGLLRVEETPHKAARVFIRLGRNDFSQKAKDQLLEILLAPRSAGDLPDGAVQDDRFREALEIHKRAAEERRERLERLHGPAGDRSRTEKEVER